MNVIISKNHKIFYNAVFLLREENGIISQLPQKKGPTDELKS